MISVSPLSIPLVPQHRWQLLGTCADLRCSRARRREGGRKEMLIGLAGEREVQFEAAGIPYNASVKQRCRSIACPYLEHVPIPPEFF